MSLLSSLADYCRVLHLCLWGFRYRPIHLVCPLYPNPKIKKTVWFLQYNFSSFAQNYNWNLETIQLILLLAAGLPFWQSEHSEKLQYAWSRNFQSYFDNTKVNVKSMYYKRVCILLSSCFYCIFNESILVLQLILGLISHDKNVISQVTFLSKIVIMLS